MPIKKDILEENIAQRKARIIEAFKASPYSVYLNCDVAGVTPTTYYKYLKEDPAFAAEIDKCKKIKKERLNQLADTTLEEAITERDPEHGTITKAAMSATFYVKNNIAKDEGYNVKESNNESDASQAIEAMNRFAKIIENTINISDVDNE